MTLLGETPYTNCFVRNEFLFDEKRGHGEYTPAVVFAFRAEPARVLSNTQQAEVEVAA